MFGKFRKYDAIDELDKNISQEENIYIESIPNQIPFIFNRIKPYLALIILILIIDFIYALIKPEQINNIISIFEVFLICINAVSGIIILKKILDAYSEVINTHYIITDKGIHMTKGGNSLIYTLFLYTDLKSISFNKTKGLSGLGDIYFKDIAEKIPKGFIKKFTYQRNGLIGIDDAEDVYNILKQIAIQANANIFFADNDNILDDMEYLKEVKKYSTKIKVNKNDSLLDRRS